MLQDKKIRPVSAMYFDAIFVIPLDNSPDLFAIDQHDDHGSLRSHLLDIVVVFSVRYLGWYTLPRHRPIARHLILYLGQTGSYQFPVNHITPSRGGYSGTITIIHDFICNKKSTKVCDRIADLIEIVVRQTGFDKRKVIR
jgi:hypothetical protein